MRLYKPKRAPGENPILRSHFIHELCTYDHAGDLAEFIDDLADENLDGDNPFCLLAVELPHLTAGLTTLTSTGRLFFRSWLRRHGIDPDTGRMTVEGLRFFGECTSPASDEPGGQYKDYCP